MVAIAGSIREVSLDGREFAVPGDADVGRILGGFENEVLPNGNNTARVKQTPVPWSVDGLTVETDDGKLDQEFLKQLADSGDFFAVALTMTSGDVYQGQGTIVGEIKMSNQSASSSISLMGPGELTKQ